MNKSKLVQALCLVAALAISANVVLCDNLNVATANLKTTPAPIVIKTTSAASLGVAVSPANIVAHGVTTTRPAVQNNAVVKQEVKVATQINVAPAVASPAGFHLSTAKPVIAAVVPGPTTVAPALVPADRVSQYFEPVCGQLDKIQPKQMFKIQSQLKQFVERTNGKMSLCFMQTYSLDPNLTPVNKAQLQTICGSRNLDLATKGSFKSFLECAVRNYDPNLDAELARIQNSRSKFSLNHDHSKDNLANLPHDEDELSLINQVVNKVIADNKVKIHDMTAKSNASVVPIIVKTTAIPLAPAVKPTTAIPVVKVQAPSLAHKLIPSSAPAKTILKESNTTVVIVNDRVANVTTQAPQKVVVTPTTAAPKLVIGSTIGPIKLVTTTAAPSQVKPATTAKPVEIKVVVTTPAPAKSTVLGVKIVTAAGAKTTPAPVNATKPTISVTVSPTAKSTAAPTAASSKTTTASGLKVTVTLTTGKPTAASTKKPVSGSTVAPKTSVAPTAATSASPSKTTGKPIKEMVKTLKKEEKKKEAIDSKVKKARDEVIKEAEKKEDELDAKKAIKSLKAERAQAHGSPADIRMHQIEHERQMSIDPVGHTTKHQEYEKKKAAVVKAASTTKKPE